MAMVMKVLDVVAMRQFWAYAHSMRSTNQKVSSLREGKRKVYTALSAAIDVEACFSMLEGRWKLVILFHLFGGQVQRFSDLERCVTGISQKMLAQQLRQLEADGIVERTVHQQVPPRVDYRMTAWGQELCPALDAILKWAELRETHAT
jgi:DNA-binding HxlR family transcriptional regulator